MTLNQVLYRIEYICLSHYQIRSFYEGLQQDFLTDKTRKYAAVYLQDNGGIVSISGGRTTLAYKFFFLDLVNVSEDTKQNERDVQSDMLSVAQDIISQLSNPNYEDWVISSDSSFVFVVEEDGDMIAGVSIDISISFMFTRNRCEIPSDVIDISKIDNDMKVYDEKYVSTGTEGSIITPLPVKGKKILFIVRENNPIYKVSSNPSSSEYTWNDTSITLGTPVNEIPGERFLILYRNY